MFFVGGDLAPGSHQPARGCSIALPIFVSPFNSLNFFQPKKRKKKGLPHVIVIHLSIGGSAKAGEGRGQAIQNASGTQGLFGDLQEHGRVPAAVSCCGHPRGQKVILIYGLPGIIEYLPLLLYISISSPIIK